MLLFCTADCKFLRVLLRLLAAEVVLVVLEVFVAVVVPFKLPVGEEPVDVELEVLFVMVELDVPLLELSILLSCNFSQCARLCGS